MDTFEREVAEIREWFESPRFRGIPQGSLGARGSRAAGPHPQRLHGRADRGRRLPRAAARALRAEEVHHYVRPLLVGPGRRHEAEPASRGSTSAAGPRSAKGSKQEDPGPDLASYPLSQVPDEAAPIVRALLTADKNQFHARSRMTEEQRRATPEVDFRPFIIADADTGHGGDAHVRNLIRRFVEVGVPGYHIEDQKPGAKKCGHQGGKVLVSQDEQIKRLSSARFQLDIMGVAGIVVARTDAESANLLDGRSDDRDQPFILGATNLDLPTFKAAFLAVLREFYRRGIEELSGHQLYAVSEAELDEAAALAREGRPREDRRGVGGAPPQGLLGGRRVRERVRPARRPLADRGRPQDVRRGRRGGDGLPHRRGACAPGHPRAVARLRLTRIALRGTRQGQVARHRHHVGLRARKVA